MVADIETLPNEILLQILSQLCIYDRISCKFVSKRWKLLSEILLFEDKAFHFGHHLRICCDTDHEVIDGKSLNYYYDRVGKVVEETSLMDRILQFTPNLKSLHVYLRNENTIDAIIKNCTRVECLTLISFDDKVIFRAIKWISSLGKTLRHLKICDESRAVSRNGMEGLLANMLSNCSNLETFHLFHIQLSPTSCPMMSNKIKELSTSIGSDSLRAITTINNFRNLENLIIRNSIINLFRMQRICTFFVNLKKLFIESYSDCDKFSQFSSIGRMSRLEHLEINFIPKLSRDYISIDSELCDIFKGCRNLKKISFSNCMNVKLSDRPLLNISACCPHMKHIYFWKFGDFNDITVTGITALAQLHDLKYLTMDALNYNKTLAIDWIKVLINLNRKLQFIYLMDYQFTKKLF